MVRSVVRWLAVPTLLGIVATVAWAADASGKWTWRQMRQQNEITIILEVKQDGEKLTGTVTQGEQKVEIKEGMVKGADVSFVVVRTRGDREIRTTYKGKLEGDVIKGVMITPGRDGGQARERPWEARRQK